MDQPISSSSQLSSTQVPNDEYKMDHKRRGKFIIFNNCFFRGTLRKEVEEDVCALRTCFQRLGFEITVHNDRTKREIKAILKALSNADHSDADCLAICVMAHGGEQSIQAKDREYDSDLLFRFLTPDKCPTLAGNPKLIFIQSCHGDIHGDNPHSDEENEYGFFHDEPEHLKINSPIWPDFFSAYCTFFDYKSFGNSPGSSLMQTIARKMTEFGSRSSIHDVFTHINCDLSQRHKSDPKEELVIVTSYSLTKRLVLKLKTE